jgi:hypothetical protein
MRMWKLNENLTSIVANSIIIFTRDQIYFLEASLHNYKGFAGVFELIAN